MPDNEPFHLDPLIFRNGRAGGALHIRVTKMALLSWLGLAGKKSSSTTASSDNGSDSHFPDSQVSSEAFNVSY